MTTQRNQVRTYERAASIVFLKTKDQFGGLSNMAPGFPLKVNGINIRSSEALYQACRFPHRSDLQSLVIKQKSPMTAKMKTKPYRNLTRPDWVRVRIEIMRWCLRVKLAQNWLNFSSLLIETGDRFIVEQSRKDDFWGAIPDKHDEILIGRNALGRLLMELREAITAPSAPDALLTVEPINIPDFKLDGRMMRRVTGRALLAADTVDDIQESNNDVPGKSAEQLGFNLDNRASGLEHKVRESTESIPFWQIKSEIRPYPAYKSSGVEWIGDVPEHWGINRLGSLLRERGEVNNDGCVTEVLSVLSNRGVIPYSEKGNIGNKRSDDITRYKLVKPLDIVVNSMNVIIGSVGISRYSGCLSPVYYVLTRRSANDHAEYLNACFQIKMFQKSLIRLGNGILAHRMRIPMELLKCEPFPHPPKNEQTSIVRFFNHIDFRIQRYIRSKQKLLQLLEENKQAVIHQAVTGQIDVRTGKPYPAYKTSGIKWLGDVPEHWEVRRLRYVANMRVSNVDKHVKDDEDPVRLCNYVDVYNNDYIDKRMDFMHATATKEEIERFRLEKDDVLITKDSETWDDIGVPALVTEPENDLISGYHLALLRPRPEMLTGAYLLRALQSKGLAYQFHVQAKGVTRYGLSHGGITSIWLPLPSLSEQTAIVRYLDKISANVEEATTRIRSQIELFQEYHTCLISDVVTGKLDVRKVASNLPNDTESMDVMDDSSEADSINDNVSLVSG